MALVTSWLHGDMIYTWQSCLTEQVFDVALLQRDLKRNFSQHLSLSISNVLPCLSLLGISNTSPIKFPLLRQRKSSPNRHKKTPAENKKQSAKHTKTRKSPKTKNNLPKPKTREENESKALWKTARQGFVCPYHKADSRSTTRTTTTTENWAANPKIWTQRPKIKIVTKHVFIALSVRTLRRFDRRCKRSIAFKPKNHKGHPKLHPNTMALKHLPCSEPNLSQTVRGTLEVHQRTSPDRLVGIMEPLLKAKTTCRPPSLDNQIASEKPTKLRTLQWWLVCALWFSCIWQRSPQTPYKTMVAKNMERLIPVDVPEEATFDWPAKKPPDSRI